MPRVKRVAKRRNDWTEHELHVLCTGVPLSPGSTRFGHPHARGWNHEAIQHAYRDCQATVEELFQQPRFDKYRDRWNGQPWAVAVMSGEASVKPAKKPGEASK